jgi:hypothetical protein
MRSAAVRENLRVTPEKATLTSNRQDALPPRLALPSALSPPFAGWPHVKIRIHQFPPGFHGIADRYLTVSEPHLPRFEWR